jgi:formamidopyrimidine-DNA glycosylase
MPELPDVEIFKQYADATSLHKIIDEIEINDDSVLEISGPTLQKHLKSHPFEKTERRGKHLFLSAGSQKWLMMHFGMTGGLKYSEQENAVPGHSRLLFHFSNGGYLAYISQRKLGKIDLTESPDKFCEEHQLGTDALEMSLNSFQELLNNKNGMIKTALMDQKMIAGLGNVYSDEILYQCKIHPKTKAKQLDEEQISQLHSTMQRILKTSIRNGADPGKMPDHYLITHREEDADCPDCGGSVHRIKVAGRGCYICPDCQQL